MSATQGWSGAVAVKSRFTRSGAGRASGSRRVVVHVPLRRLTPAMPVSRIRRAIRLRPCLSPPARSSAWTRGAPQVPREMAWMVRTRFNNAASDMARAEAGRRRQAW